MSPSRAHVGFSILAISFGLAVSTFISNHEASAQASFPSRPVKFIVPTPPGTMVDLLPRMLAEKLTARWGQPVVVENRSGAAQIIGADTVAKAEPDGHTLLVTPPAPLVLNRWLDPTRHQPDFVPVTILATFPQVLVVNPKVPAKTFAEWIAYAKENHGRMSYGSPGAGSTAQLAQEELMRALGIELVHVPYQGMGPAINDLLAGQIEAMFAAVGTALPHIESGALRPLALTGGKRLPRFPDLPVITETLPTFNHTEWFAIVAPPQTPLETAAKISDAISEGLRSPDIRERLRHAFLVPVGNSPAEAAAFIARESQRWHAVVDSEATAKHK